ncbi:YihY/virulence factor BrkB family protein [uncultured Bacteroides sp.]|uniref:YihY/virulence factor BrkB family protein n=1 Tax=uncultured Bacteroides sp. TaxID=162156 RepID=UPI002AABD03A|nr:YihY/virulence factor BrkB family protein [uncultured Bacteroides sp.]
MNKRIKMLLNFFTYDIWRVSETEVTHTKFSFYNYIKTIILAVRRFNTDRITDKASALTYSTLLSIVPLLAILFAIARGFGFDHMMEEQVKSSLGSQEVATETILNFVESYLKQTKSGIFVGVGLVLLLWTVVNLTGKIELTFNNIWQVKKPRTLYRKITDYFSMFLLLPVLIVVSGGLTIFMSTMIKSMEGFVVLAPILKFLVRLIPFVLTWFMFTALYIFMPNTKVQFKHAFISGIIAGTAYQAFQFLYISGQISVTKYNAIYGSFAAIPLFLLWLQISWTICLFGAELTYAGQNIKNFNFEKDTKNISRRYRDFISILIMSLICKRFEKGETPYTAEEISLEHKIPIRLTNHILDLLQNINLIHEVVSDTKSEDIIYQPSMDINKLDVGLLLNRIDTNGSEDFKVDKDEEFRNHWQTLIESRDLFIKRNSQILLKDL